MDKINERLKELRAACKKNQRDFGKVLGISSSGVANIEAGSRKVNEKHILMLSNWNEYKVNIDWLRTGEGEMFLPEESDALETIRREYHLSDEQFRFFSNFLKLPEGEKDVIFHFLESVFSSGETIEERIGREVAEYKADLEMEVRQGEKSSVCGLSDREIKKEA